MLTALGSETLRAAIPLMGQLTTMFNNIGAFTAAHPTAMKIIGEGVAALGVASVAAGGLASRLRLGRRDGWCWASARLALLLRISIQSGRDFSINSMSVLLPTTKGPARLPDLLLPTTQCSIKTAL
jgi:hypothetical protein